MKTVTLNESAYRKLVNEISYGLVDSAYSKSYKLFDELSSRFDDFYSALNDASYDSRFEDDDNGELNPYLGEIKKHADVIREILTKKIRQQDKFRDELNKVDYSKFLDSDESDASDMDDVHLSYLKNKYPK